MQAKGSMQAHRRVSTMVEGKRASSLYAGITIVKDLVASSKIEGAGIYIKQHALLIFQL
jgi:hypothetical protein